MQLQAALRDATRATSGCARASFDTILSYDVVFVIGCQRAETVKLAGRTEQLSVRPVLGQSRLRYRYAPFAAKGGHGAANGARRQRVTRAVARGGDSG